MVRKMLGGYFDGHPWGIFQAPLVVEDAQFPRMKFLQPSFDLRDEIYQIKDFSRENSRVLLGLDASKLDLTRKGVKQTEHGFPVIWAHSYGKGRVLYNGLGHVDAVWERPDMQKMWIEMVKWSLGLVPGDATPQPIQFETLRRSHSRIAGCAYHPCSRAAAWSRISRWRIRCGLPGLHVPPFHRL
jgi:type 1 glutamine amidotransferase